MTSSVSEKSISEEERSGVEQIDYWSSHPINWPALYVIGCLMLAAVGANLWAGNYDSAVSSALILTGGMLLARSHAL
jgi:hypothetical protein